MRRILITTIVAGLIGFGLAWGGCLFFREMTTVARLSPDETLRASLVEREKPSVDRNFQVRIEDLVTGESTTVFRSPAEGMPYGTERLIWSKDGRYLLLVGRHCFVKEDLFLDNGDQLYFLYHLPTRRAWSNADQSTLPPLQARTIDGIEFTEPVRLKPR